MKHYQLKKVYLCLAIVIFVFLVVAFLNQHELKLLNQQYEKLIEQRHQINDAYKVEVNRTREAVDQLMNLIENQDLR